MKNLINTKFIFLFLIELGSLMLSIVLLPNLKFISYTFALILFLTSGYKLNKTIEKVKILTHEKAFIYSIVEISIWSALLVVFQGFNNYLTIFLTVAFYLSLFAIISLFAYLIIKSIDKKDNMHIKYVVLLVSVILLLSGVNQLKEFLNNDIFINIISLYFNIAITMLIFYIFTFTTYKCLKLNSQ